MKSHSTESRRPCARTASRVARPSFEPTPRPPSSGGTSVWTSVIAPGDLR